MRLGLFCLLATIIAAGTPRAAFAQEPHPQTAAPVCTITDEISLQCLMEFDHWFKQELDYRKWMDLNRNKPVYSVWSGSLTERKARPIAPSWLSSYCEGTFQADITSDQICPRYTRSKTTIGWPTGIISFSRKSFKRRNRRSIRRSPSESIWTSGTWRRSFRHRTSTA